MIDRYQTIIDTQRDWLLDRPIMARENQCSYRALLQFLADEVEEAIIEADEVDKQIELCGGALPYTIDRFVKELDDIFLFTLQGYTMAGVDFYTSVMDKMAQNHLKHEAALYDTSGARINANASYGERRKIAREVWNRDNGYENYYQVDQNGNRWDE